MFKSLFWESYEGCTSFIFVFQASITPFIHDWCWINVCLKNVCTLAKTTTTTELIQTFESFKSSVFKCPLNVVEFFFSMKMIFFGFSVSKSPFFFLNCPVIRCLLFYHMWYLTILTQFLSSCTVQKIITLALTLMSSPLESWIL